ncbi:hypothetical protein N566_00835 [Streptomycetaceae bacterium MP113-05]|nr:hypothetical protein N566_00835 [Streptomycetaceae bacterium MP113-05]
MPHREPPAISAWSHERRWSIRGGEPFQSMSLTDGRTDDLAGRACAKRRPNWNQEAVAVRQLPSGLGPTTLGG